MADWICLILNTGMCGIKFLHVKAHTHLHIPEIMFKWAYLQWVERLLKSVAADGEYLEQLQLKSCSSRKWFAVRRTHYLSHISNKNWAPLYNHVLYQNVLSPARLAALVRASDVSRRFWTESHGTCTTAISLHTHTYTHTHTHARTHTHTKEKKLNEIRRYNFAIAFMG